MHFGHINAHATFQNLMNDISKPFFRSFVLVFFDDILVYNRNLVEHVHHRKSVLEVLRNNTLYEKMPKCKFGLDENDYLGYVISGCGVRANKFKIESMLEWPFPTSLKALRGFLCLMGYYRNFIRHYDTIAAPLTTFFIKNSFCVE